VIRDARRRAGLSQEELAERVGATRRQVIRWEGDQNAPSEEYRRRLEDRMHALEARSLDLEKVMLSHLQEVEARLNDVLERLSNPEDR
jgi:transcriptional regulator with XRE-family HTH domain